MRLDHWQPAPVHISKYRTLEGFKAHMNNHILYAMFVNIDFFRYILFVWFLKTFFYVTFLHPLESTKLQLENHGFSFYST
mgnify:CR=1 FL=1